MAKDFIKCFENEKERIKRIIQVKRDEIVLTSYKKDKDSIYQVEDTQKYTFTAYNKINEAIFVITTAKCETIVFNMVLCTVIANIPNLVEVEYDKIVNQIFIRIIEKEKQSIYDEWSNLLASETEYDIRVIFNGERPAIKKTDRKTGKNLYIEI